MRKAKNQRGLYQSKNNRFMINRLDRISNLCQKSTIIPFGHSTLTEKITNSLYQLILELSAFLNLALERVCKSSKKKAVTRKISGLLPFIG
jgi:hypothetical protein